MSSDEGSGRHRGAADRPYWPVLRRVSQVVGAVLSLALFATAGYAWRDYRAIDQKIQSVPIQAIDDPGTPAPSGSGSASSSAPEIEAQNILIVGDDSRAGLSQSEGRVLHTGDGDVTTTSTDVIMILHIPAGGKRATIISIPRDSYVDIGHGYIKNKINAAYIEEYNDTSGTPEQKEAAGANLLIEVVQNLTGVKINRYVQVGFSGFEKIAGVIGTLPVNLCQNVSDPTGSGFVMSAGHHTLNAVQMLKFVRQRDNLPGGDLAREKRQQYFLATAFDQALSLGVLTSPSRLHQLSNIIKNSFVIDGFSSVIDFADQMSNLTGNNIAGYTIPTQAGPDVPRVGSVLDVNPAQVKQSIQKWLNGAGSSPAASASASVAGAPAAGAPAAGAPAAGKAKKAACVN